MSCVYIYIYIYVPPVPEVTIADLAILPQIRYFKKGAQRGKYPHMI